VNAFVYCTCSYVLTGSVSRPDSNSSFKSLYSLSRGLGKFTGSFDSRGSLCLYIFITDPEFFGDMEKYFING
jgi:hypothetical protein